MGKVERWVAGKMYLLVMGNVFDTDRVIHQRYDLKVPPPYPSLRPTPAYALPQPTPYPRLRPQGAPPSTLPNAVTRTQDTIQAAPPLCLACGTQKQ